MFYRIRDNKLYDYADYEYANDCLQTDKCTMMEFDRNRENYLIDNGELKELPNLPEVIAERRKNNFEKEFFFTSLGWIRRKVTMKDGTIKDFLSDLLIPIKTGMEMGREVEILTYDTPDFSKELTPEYIITLQRRKIAELMFIQECLMQTVRDFGLNEGENYGI